MDFTYLCELCQMQTKRHWLKPWIRKNRKKIIVDYLGQVLDFHLCKKCYAYHQNYKEMVNKRINIMPAFRITLSEQFIQQDG